MTKIPGMGRPRDVLLNAGLAIVACLAPLFLSDRALGWLGFRTSTIAIFCRNVLGRASKRNELGKRPNWSRKKTLKDYKVDNQYFLEPGDPRVVETLATTVVEIVAAYPGRRFGVTSKTPASRPEI